jgi:hypothetical protein
MERGNGNDTDSLSKRMLSVSGKTGLSVFKPGRSVAAENATPVFALRNRKH